jgi:hypothetical protein
MSTPPVTPEHFGFSRPIRHQFFTVLGLTILAISPFLFLPRFTDRLLATNFLPHLYCKLVLRSATDGKYTLCVEDSGIGVPADLDASTSKSPGLKLVRLLTQQIRGSFELAQANPGTSASLHFTVDNHAR